MTSASVRPIFVNGEMIAMAQSNGHWAGVGARSRTPLTSLPRSTSAKACAYPSPDRRPRGAQDRESWAARSARRLTKVGRFLTWSLPTSSNLFGPVLPKSRRMTSRNHCWRLGEFCRGCDRRHGGNCSDPAGPAVSPKGLKVALAPARFRTILKRLSSASARPTEIPQAISSGGMVAGA